MNWNDNLLFNKYYKNMKDIVQLAYPHHDDYFLYDVMNYSFNKRFKDTEVTVKNSYKKVSQKSMLSALIQYIESKEPIITPYGVMFKRKEDGISPLISIIDDFLISRKVEKSEMFKYPKNSRMYEKHNLMQLLHKLDANATYGNMGSPTSIFFNIDVAASITALCRSAISSAGICFEAILTNGVKFTSLNELMTFINRVVNEEYTFNDNDILDENVTIPTVLYHIIDSCGFMWMPDEEELEFIYNTLCNLSNHQLNRLYYKNNLYSFVDNSYVKKLLIKILNTMDEPFMNPMNPPKNILDDLNHFVALIMEFVYARYAYMDREDRMDNMIKRVIVISDTDSAIISLDAWYNWGLHELGNYINNTSNMVMNSPIKILNKDEYINPIKIMDIDYSYDFIKDDIYEKDNFINPINIMENKNLEMSIINILVYALDSIINDYMLLYCELNNSHNPDANMKCYINMKNEFYIQRMLLMEVKKAYAGLVTRKEEKMIPNTIDMALDVKGIPALVKSDRSYSTREELNKIMYYDILNAKNIDTVRIIEKLKILEKKIFRNIMSGGLEYYKPAIVKPIKFYKKPQSQQSIKAITAWNLLHLDGEMPIDINERNSIYIVKVNLDKKRLNHIKNTNKELYDRLIKAMEHEYLKGGIDNIALSKSAERIPQWLLDIVDYQTIINNNVSGFPLESLGLPKASVDNVTWTNVVQL